MRKRLAPPPKLTISTWADRHRVLSRESSAAPGKWRTDRAPYLREIMDAFSEPLIERIVFMKPGQVGATEVILNVIGFHIDRDPAPILVVQPNVKPMGESFSKDRLAPMIRDSPRLTGKVRDPRARDSGNTILHKVFSGGQVTVVGANSPAGLASRPIRILLLDEVDRYPLSAGTEGDPMSLAIQRTETFWNRKIAAFSTPGDKGVSRIEREWESSDQRRFEVPCPHCARFQILEWPRLKFSRDDHGDVVPESVHYECAGCPRPIEETHKLALVRGGRWVATHPGRRVAGFHINALYSPWSRWPALAQGWIDAQQDREQLKAFINLKLGELWEDRSEKLEPTALAERAEQYGAGIDVPAAVGVLTAAVDVHPDRLELLVVGWGADEESWRIAHHRIMGDTEQADPWQRLEPLLTKAYAHAGGATLRLQAVMVDSGNQTVTVYRFVRPRETRNIFACKGDEGGRGGPPLARARRKNRYGIKLFTIGTMALKDALFSRLRIQQPGARYMHFRTMLPDGGFDGEYFAQFGAERAVIERVRGRPVRRYVQTRDRNEAIDLEVMNLAALHALGAGVREHLAQWVARVQQEGEKRRAEGGAPAVSASSSMAADRLRQIRGRPPGRGGWINRL